MLSHPAGAYVGLHPDVLSAFRSREAAQILSFASKLTADESILADGSSLFRDGLIIKLGPEWGNESRGPVSQLAPQVDISPGPQPGNRTLSTSADVGQPERTTQDRVVALFRDELCYRYLGDWTDRDESGHDT